MSNEREISITTTTLKNGGIAKRYYNGYRILDKKLNPVIVVTQSIFLKATESLHMKIDSERKGLIII